MNTKQLLYSLSYPQILTALERKEIIATIKDQSDMIAELQKELAKKMKEIDQKESYHLKNGRR
jgi:hypothetical protein